MAEEIFEALGPHLARWTMGSPAPPAATLWRTEIGNEPVEAELRLLALSSHFLAIAVVAEPQGALRTLPDIPALAMPTVGPALRPLTRRLLTAMNDPRQRGRLPRFLAHRGWTLHPDDWMPAAGDDDAPDVYAPWRDWAETVASGAHAGRRDGVLSAESWADFGSAARANALRDLRLRDPAAARLLFEAKLAGENAEARLRLLGVMADGLSEADAAFLEGLAAADRAPRVKALATSLLGRLGRGAGAGEDVAELAGFFAVETKGLFRRTRSVVPQMLKTPAQRIRRAALFETADLAAFSHAVALSPTDLVAAWSFGSDQSADLGLVQMVERSGSAEIVATLAELLGDRDGISLPAMTALSPRLLPAQRSRFARRILAIGSTSFASAEEIADGFGRIDDPLANAAGAALLAALQDDAEPARKRATEIELIALGQLASRAGAEWALSQLKAAGLVAADPRLDMLRLNAALEDKGRQ